MPTGYTADIKDGISFETFALNCAKAFGACISLRDAPADTPIPEAFAPGSYHLTALAESRATLGRLEAMGDAEATRAANNEWDRLETARQVRLSELADQRTKYEAMLAQVQAWKPPTPDHEGLGRFMCEQIEQSIEFDCRTSYYERPTPRVDGPTWLAASKADALRNIAYHEEHHADEVKRTTERTEWVKALRASLGR